MFIVSMVQKKGQDKGPGEELCWGNTQNKWVHLNEIWKNDIFQNKLSFGGNLPIKIRRPLLVRGHQAARDGNKQSLNHWSLILTFFNVPSSTGQSSSVSMRNSPVDQSAGDQSAICCSAHQQSGIGNCSTVSPGVLLHPLPGVVPQLGVSLVRPWD